MEQLTKQKDDAQILVSKVVKEYFQPKPSPPIMPFK